MSLRSGLGLVQLATASQKKMKSLRIPEGFAWIIKHIPRNAESFSSLSRMFRRLEHLQICYLIKMATSFIIIIIIILPLSHKLWQTWSNFGRTDVTQSSYRDCYKKGHRLTILKIV